jgi:hypothetical protein
MEPRQVYHHPVLGGAIDAKRKVLRLGRLLNTFFCMNENFIFPEVMTLQLDFNLSKLGYLTSTAPGVLPPADEAPLGNLAISINKVMLYHCVETDPNLIMDMQEELKRGISVPVPCVQTEKLQLSNLIDGASVSRDVYLNPTTHGGAILKIITCPFANGETGATAFDRSNVNGSKIRSYRTLLNDDQIQQFPIRCTSGDNDNYLLMKSQYDGSSTQNQNMAEYFFCHCDDWSNNIKTSDRYVVTGLKNTSQKYTITIESLSSRFNN